MRYSPSAARLTSAWLSDPATKMNPHFNYAQGVPGSNDGRPAGMIEAGGLVESAGGTIALKDGALGEIARRELFLDAGAADLLTQQGDGIAAVAGIGAEGRLGHDGL